MHTEGLAAPWPFRAAAVAILWLDSERLPAVLRDLAQAPFSGHATLPRQRSHHTPKGGLFVRQFVPPDADMDADLADVHVVSSYRYRACLAVSAALILRRLDPAPRRGPC